MTGEEKDLLKKYLTELNVLGPDGSHPTSKPGTKKSAMPKAPTLQKP